MAKNYTITEVVEIINAGTDMESITDIGRRFPILLNKVTRVAAKAGDDFVDLMKYMPEHLTANKVNNLMKNNVVADASEADDEELDAEEVESKDAEVKNEKPVKAPKAVKKEKTESTGSNYESMSGKELWELLGKAGKRKELKEKMGGATKQHMIDFINKYGLGDAVEEEGIEVEAVEVETEENPYEGKSAMELFKECKKRGIKAEAKKPAKYYAELLAKADAEATEESDSEADDDWGDEAEEPKAEEKKPAKKEKAAKKPVKEEEADNDDDWDI